MKTTKTRKPYHLYRWRWPRNSSLPRRGRKVASYAMYRDLVADAKRRTRELPEGGSGSRWMEVFDWAKD